MQPLISSTPRLLSYSSLQTCLHDEPPHDDSFLTTFIITASAQHGYCPAAAARCHDSMGKSHFGDASHKYVTPPHYTTLSSRPCRVGVPPPTYRPRRQISAAWPSRRMIVIIVHYAGRGGSPADASNGPAPARDFGQGAAGRAAWVREQRGSISPTMITPCASADHDVDGDSRRRHFARCHRRRPRACATMS